MSILIVNWNTRTILLQCLQSIKDSTHDIAYEIIVVDNDSDDGSADAVAAQHPDIKLIRSNTNLGFAAANNLAVEHASGEYLLLLNPDTKLTENSIKIMLEFLQLNPDAGAVGCRLLNSDGSVQESYWTSFPSIPWLWVRALYLDKFKLGQEGAVTAVNQPLKVEHLLGACIMMSRKMWQQLGGFDESYFIYLEETDLCYRLRQAGFSIYYLPSTSIIHYGQQSSIQAAKWTNTQLYLNMYKFIRKYQIQTVSQRLVLQGVIGLGAVARIALWSSRCVTRPSERQSALDMINGYWRLLLTIPSFEHTYRKDMVHSDK